MHLTLHRINIPNWGILVVILSLLMSCINGEYEKTRVLLDSDANNELDDQHAIAYLLFNGDYFDVEGITVNKTINGGDVDQHFKEAERVVKLCNLHNKIDIYKGANGTFEEIKNHINESNFDGMDAVNFIIERAHVKSDRKLVLLPVGKLTNIALALFKDPSIASKVRIVWLGSSGTAAVQALLSEIEKKMPGLGPAISEPVPGRHGNEFTNFGDYSISLFRNIDDYDGDPPSRALYDMAAIAIVKNSSWAIPGKMPSPELVNGTWIDRPDNSHEITIWENFDKEKIMKDFYHSMENYVLVTTSQ
jgi:hypothetical protein